MWYSLLRVMSHVPVKVMVTLAAVAVLSAQVAAQTYPDRLIKIVSPYSPGGLGDTVPRLIATELIARLGQQVIVENRPGASQIIGAQAVAKSPPDGYTLLFGSITSLALNVSVQKNLPYDPVKDFAPVALSVTTPMYLVVNPRVPARSVKELIGLIKGRPDKITFASGGIGSSNHLAGELFRSLAQVNIVHVPYKGANPGMIDVVAGRIDMMFAATAFDYVKQGKVRVLAVTSSKRAAAAPDVPTMQEAGVPGYDATIWFGIVAPANTPKPIVARLSEEIRNALAIPAVRNRLAGVEITPSTPEEFAALIQTEIPKWRKVIQDGNIVLQE